MASNSSGGVLTGKVCRDEVVRIARSWIGTPYHHQASCIGVGADCLGLVRGVYRSLYAQEAEEPPPYSPDWGEASGQETLISAARRNFCEGDVGDPQPGDVLVFRMCRGAIAKHAAILVSASTMAHAVERIGVIEIPFAHWWRRRLVGVFVFPGIEV